MLVKHPTKLKIDRFLKDFLAYSSSCFSKRGGKS